MTNIISNIQTNKETNFKNQKESELYKKIINFFKKEMSNINDFWVKCNYNLEKINDHCRDIFTSVSKRFLSENVYDNIKIQELKEKSCNEIINDIFFLIGDNSRESFFS